MTGKVWVYMRWVSELHIGVMSASQDWWDEYFQDWDPLNIVRVEAKELVR